MTSWYILISQQMFGCWKFKSIFGDSGGWLQVFGKQRERLWLPSILFSTRLLSLHLFLFPRLNVKPNAEAPTLQKPQDILLLLRVPSTCPHLHGKHGFSQNCRGIHSDIQLVCDEYLISGFLTMQSATQLSFSSFLR